MKHTSPSHGFSLIELLIVLGIFGTLAAIILPNLGISASSQMAAGIRDFTTTMRSTYDAAALTGRIHRLVMVPKTGEYWAEAAPLGFEGRPSVVQEESSASDTFKTDIRTRLVEELDKLAGDARKSADSSPTSERKYIVRSPLVLHRRALVPIKWTEIDDPVLYKRSLPGAIAFATINTENMRQKLEFVAAQPKETAYIYFFPSGTASQASVQLGTLATETTLAENGAKFTVILDALTGHSELLEGFQEADFVKETR